MINPTNVSYVGGTFQMEKSQPVLLYIASIQLSNIFHW